MTGNKIRKGIVLITSVLLVTCLCMLLTACSGGGKVIMSAKEIEIDYDTSRIIQFCIEMESGAQIEGDLYPLNAPITVRNFVKLCDESYYDGTEFDYVIANRMIMCSGKDEDRPPYTIYGEFSANKWLNSMPHYSGTVSMTHKDDDYNSAYSKFFIILENRSDFNGEYASFGKITSGFANLEAISKVSVDGTTPLEPQTIKTIKILGNIQ